MADKKQNKMQKVMHDYKVGTLKSSNGDTTKSKSNGRARTTTRSFGRSNQWSRST